MLTTLMFITYVMYGSAIELDFTVEVLPAKKECFHQPITKGVSVDVEYQVIDGGDLDINFVVKNPGGQVMVTDVRKTENYHKFTAPMDGDFQFCLDNSFSRFSEKVVFFELLTDEPNEKIANIDADYDMESKFEMKIEDFRDYVHAIGTRMDTSMQTIRLLKSIESRDRFTMERNFERVNFWSSVQLFVMVSVALVQVLMIRGLFTDDKKATHGAKQRT